MVFSRYSSFLHQENWLPRYNWNIVETSVTHYNPTPYNGFVILLFVIKAIVKYWTFHSVVIIFINFFIKFWNLNKLEKKYNPALDNYGQICFVRSDLQKMKWL